ncbi:MAG: STAS domain-containing protein [Planctomycetota bacterium]|jgi:anti-anti-sigma factor
MSIENFTEDILVATLPDDMQVNKTLKEVNELMSSGRECNVIIDFSRIEFITSSSISNLHILRDLVNKSGHKLVLCQVAMPTKCVFRVLGIEEIYTFADDKFSAMDILQGQTSPTD